MQPHGRFDTGVGTGRNDGALKRAEPSRLGRFLPRTAHSLAAALLGLALQAEAQTVTLLSNRGVDNILWVTANDSTTYAQQLHTGTNASGGYTLRSIVLEFSGLSIPRGTVTVTVREEKTGYEPSDNVLYTLTNPGTIDFVSEFTAPVSARLDANTNYWVVLSTKGGRTGWRRVWLRNRVDVVAAEGWQFLNAYKENTGTGWTTPNSNHALKIEVKGAINIPATGAPTISGTARVGETLTASTAGIADANGLTGAVYSYQWIRDYTGSVQIIPGATSVTYTPVELDVGKKLKVKVSFQDDDGGREELTSAPYPASETGVAAFDPTAGICGRTPQVRDAIVAAVPGVSSCRNLTESHLAAIAILDLQRKGITALKVGDFDGLNSLIRLWLRHNELSALPVGIFDGLTSLTTLYVNGNGLTSLPVGIFGGLTELRDLHLSDNALTSLPAGIFGGLTELKLIWLRGNALTLLPAGIFAGLTEPLIELVLSGNAANPLPLTVSLEKVGTNQFKAVAPSGAPFELVLPIRIRNGSISGGATTLTIPVGSAESDTLTVTRTTGTSGAVSVWIGPLPSLPARHTGYRLVKSTGEFRPLEVFEDISEQIWSGTITGGTWGNDFGNGNATGYGYSRHHNAGSISNPTFTYRGTTYTIHGISLSRIGNNLTHQYSLTISPRFPACDKKLLALGSLRLSDAGEGSAYGAMWYRWLLRTHEAWPVGHQINWRITLHPTTPEAPIVTAIDDGNQVKLHWATPCDGGKDITRHEYRQKTGSGTFGSWIPIPNSGAGGVNVASYTLTNVNNPLDVVYEVRAVNELGEGSVSAPVSSSDRTPQVAEAILNVVKLDYPNVSSFADITGSHLVGITALYLNGKKITALKSGDFKGLTSLTELRLNGNQLTTLPEGIFDGLTALRNLNLYNNHLSSLPDSIFEGLTALTQLRLGGNSVDPLPLTVSLEKVGTDQFNAVAPAGAPFDIVLPLTVTNGTISGGATTITIAKGSVESQPLTVTPTPGTTAPVTVNIGTLPSIPSGHYGYTLVKSSDLPLEIFGSGVTGGQATTDFNGDGRTDFVDFFLFADAYGGTDARFDLDGNGTVDFADFFKFVDAFGS